MIGLCAIVMVRHCNDLAIVYLVCYAYTGFRMMYIAKSGEGPTSSPMDQGSCEQPAENG